MKKLVVLLGIISLFIVGGVALAADTTVTLTAGNNQTVKCTGTKLDQVRINTKSVKLYCRGTPTTTTKPPVTTTTPPTTTMPPTTTQPPAGSNCTSNPQGTFQFSSSKIVGSNGFNTYVSNNMWGGQPGTVQTICAKNPSQWTVSFKSTQDQGGAVQTYPNTQHETNNWRADLGTWGDCGSGTATCSSTPLNQLTSFQSTYNVTDPPANLGAWWSGYDIWTSSGELMIITTYSDFRLANNGATIKNPDVVVGGQHFTDMNYGGGLPQMVLHGNQKAGSVDILAVIKYWQSQGVVGANPTMDQFDFGWEMCDSYRNEGVPQTLNFALNDYTVTGS